MRLQQLIPYIPFKSLVFFFILWANSSYIPEIKNVGFYCDDESLMKPFRGDSIHVLVLFTVLLGIFPLLMYITEMLMKKFKSKEEFPQYSLRFLLRNYYSGFLFLLGFTEVLKLFFCELRPHFFATCSPDMSNIRCSDGYITQFNCTGKTWKNLHGRDVYKSFPSGHASLSVFSFIFFNVYLSTRIKSTQSLSLWWSRSISVITLLWTITCCLSRIFDNRHFWWDVLVGVVIGIFGGLITMLGDAAVTLLHVYFYCLCMIRQAELIESIQPSIIFTKIASSYCVVIGSSVLTTFYNIKVNKALKTVLRKRSTLNSKCGVT